MEVSRAGAGGQSPEGLGLGCLLERRSVGSPNESLGDGGPCQAGRNPRPFQGGEHTQVPLGWEPETGFGQWVGTMMLLNCGAGEDS